MLWSQLRGLFIDHGLERRLSFRQAAHLAQHRAVIVHCSKFACVINPISGLVLLDDDLESLVSFVQSMNSAKYSCKIMVDVEPVFLIQCVGVRSRVYRLAEQFLGLLPSSE